MPSFDIVSKVDMQEVDNAVNQAIGILQNGTVDFFSLRSTRYLPGRHNWKNLPFYNSRSYSSCFHRAHDQDPLAEKRIAAGCFELFLFLFAQLWQDIFIYRRRHSGKEKRKSSKQLAAIRFSASGCHNFGEKQTKNAIIKWRIFQLWRQVRLCAPEKIYGTVLKNSYGPGWLALSTSTCRPFWNDQCLS